MPEGRLTIGTRRYSSWSLRGWLSVHLAKLDVEDVVIPLDGGGPNSEVARTTPSGMVPYLEHRGLKIWETLAIAEYCAELAPHLWPETLEARTHARTISAEMHAGFRPLRQAMPMVLGRIAPGLGQTPEALADIARIQHIWRETRQAYAQSGPYLFGATFTNADAMFAPVVARFQTYQPPLAPDTQAYCDAVLAHPLMQRWYAEAAQEPLSWRLDDYETSK